MLSMVVPAQFIAPPTISCTSFLWRVCVCVRIKYILFADTMIHEWNATMFRLRPAQTHISKYTFYDRFGIRGTLLNMPRQIGLFQKRIRSFIISAVTLFLLWLNGYYQKTTSKSIYIDTCTCINKIMIYSYLKRCIDMENRLLGKASTYSVQYDYNYLYIYI